MKNVHVTLAALSFLAWCGTTLAQSKKVDSLLHVLESNTASDQTEVLWGLAYELFDVDNDQALFYGKRAYEGALENGDSLQIVKVGTTYGQLLRRMDRIDESIKVSSLLLPVSKRHSFRKYTKMLLNSLALAHTFNEEYDKSLEHHFESLTMRQIDGYKKEISYSMHNIGLVYYKVGDYKLALDYYFQSLRIMNEEKDKYDLDILFCDIGACYNDLGAYQKALEYLQYGLDIADGKFSRKGIAIAECGIGEALIQMKKYSAAESHLKRSLRMALVDKLQRIQIHSLLLLAESALMQNNLIACDVYLRRAESQPAISEYTRLAMEINHRQANLYSRSGDFEKAVLFLQKYITLKDGIFNSEMNIRLQRVQMEFAHRENLTKIENQSKVLEFQHDAIARQRWLAILSTVVTILTGIVALILYTTNRRKSTINSILDKRVKERTVELEQQRDQIRHTHDEQLIAVSRVSRELTASLATLRGLSFAAAKDLPKEQAIYFKQAEATAEKIAQTVVLFNSHN